jgi:hypothetical protein
MSRIKNVPFQFPLANTVMWITAGSYWQIPGWSWGVLGCLVVLSWAVWVKGLFSKEK